MLTIGSARFFNHLPVAALASMAMWAVAASALAGQTTYGYDNLGRLTRVTFADGSYTRYEYDQDGNRKLKVTVARPTLLIHRVPSPMIANEAFQVRWQTTGATSLSYSCTAASTGFNESNPIPPNGSASSPGASLGWVGFDSNCVWSASGPGGQLARTEILRTIASAPGRPTLNIKRVPNPMVAGRPFRVVWTTTGAATLTFLCTAPAPGYNGNGPLPVNGFAESNAAEPGWVGSPSACRWTATAANGAVTIFDESLVTIPDADAQAAAPATR